MWRNKEKELVGNPSFCAILSPLLLFSSMHCIKGIPKLRDLINFSPLIIRGFSFFLVRKRYRVVLPLN